jgi:hypothetical protein
MSDLEGSRLGRWVIGVLGSGEVIGVGWMPCCKDRSGFKVAMICGIKSRRRKRVSVFFGAFGGC